MHASDVCFPSPATVVPGFARLGSPDLDLASHNTPTPLPKPPAGPPTLTVLTFTLTVGVGPMYAPHRTHMCSHAHTTHTLPKAKPASPWPGQAIDILHTRSYYYSLYHYVSGYSCFTAAFGQLQMGNALNSESSRCLGLKVRSRRQQLDACSRPIKSVSPSPSPARSAPPSSRKRRRGLRFAGGLTAGATRARAGLQWWTCVGRCGTDGRRPWAGFS